MARTQTDCAVYKTDPRPKYTMAFICTCCGKPAIATGDDERGLFVGKCGAGTNSTVMAS